MTIMMFARPDIWFNPAFMPGHAQAIVIRFPGPANDPVISKT